VLCKLYKLGIVADLVFQVRDYDSRLIRSLGRIHKPNILYKYKSFSFLFRSPSDKALTGLVGIAAVIGQASEEEGW
jgi:hypothetical protein